jgi:acyl-CoA reductase-like NAD-dependent aldehyde dehydrogenase
MSPTLKVRNPRSGVFDYEITPWRENDVAASAARLRAGQRDWSQNGLDYRIAAMLRWAKAVDAAADEIAKALYQDTGRWTISRSEAHGVGAKVRRWCADAPALLETRETASKIAPNVAFRQQYVAYPLVGVISPWNFPLTLALIDALPALVAGCAVLVKPSELTPRFIAPLREAIRSVPELATVFDFATGDGETGAAVVDAVDMVCFTGSVTTGRKVGEAAARAFIPSFLELGGKDPAIVLNSADLDRAADAILRQGVVNSGQVCLSIERVYVDESVFEPFVDLLTKKARALELNMGEGGRGELGPIISAAQTRIIREQLDEALRKGATLRCGGKIHSDGGDWLDATVVTGVDHGMRLMREETFGPVLPVMAFASVEQAIALANDTDFGLSAAVFAGDEAEALAVAERIEAGAVSINDAGLQSVTTEAEKNSFKFSGIGGSRMGGAGLMRFFRRKALMVQRGAPRTMAAFAEAGGPTETKSG